MSGPTFSPDGDWMWNGTEWIPAPPKKEVLPQSSIDDLEISNIASELGVDPERLKQTAPYFDQNQDQVLQQSELQQAAMSIANQPNVPYPQPAHKQQFANAAPMAGGPVGGMRPSSKFKAPHPLNWVSLGLTIVIITFTFIAMFSDSWMTGEEDEYNVYFGLSEVGYTEDGDSDSTDYSDSRCQADDDCEDAGDAGTTGLIFLWFAVITSICSLVLIGLNSFGVFKSKYFGMIFSFVAGGLALLGTLLWLIVFPEIKELDDVADLGPGFAFYFALIGGILGIVVGILEVIAGRSDRSLNAPMYGMTQQQFGQQKQYKQW